MLEEKIQKEMVLIEKVRSEVSRHIVGQQQLVDRLLAALMIRGHVLIEGMPGLAKTSMVNVLAKLCDLHMSRIQFTPDLLPADVVGTEVYDPKNASFFVKKGPVFANLVLADEINRAPAKVQSALLQAMQERNVTIGENHFELDDPFVVLATQNPIEQEGTYSLPEAQLDRFTFNVLLSYGTREDELEILRKVIKAKPETPETVLLRSDLGRWQQLVYEIHVGDKIREYIVNIVFATREPEKAGLKELKAYLQYGASPRATINFDLAARASAFLQGRSYVNAQDIKDLAADILRHRIIRSFEAEAQGITADQIVAKILAAVPVP